MVEAVLAYNDAPDDDLLIQDAVCFKFLNVIEMVLGGIVAPRTPRLLAVLLRCMLV